MHRCRLAALVRVILLAAEEAEFESALSALSFVCFLIDFGRLLAFGLWAPAKLVALIDGLGD